MIPFDQLLAPLSFEFFLDSYYGHIPHFTSGSAQEFRRLVSWDSIGKILETAHEDCWLVNRGRLMQKPDGTRSINIGQAMAAYAQGGTILVRHSEQAHEAFAEIANHFFEQFKKPIDIQLYLTPANNEGFDWHYDIEDVFVFQSSGVKEFTLWRNSDSCLSINNTLPKSHADLKRRTVGSPIQCLLQSGDFLYIPRGFWHKAKAITDSAHMSVGVLDEND